MPRHTLATVGVALVLVFAGCAGASPLASSSSSAAADQAPASPSEESTIHVAGSGSADAAPDQAVIRVGVVATAPDAATARQRLASNVSRMRSALEDVGVAEIRTQRYDIDRRPRRPREEGEEPQLQYRASHDFQITVSDPDKVGTVIDTAVQNGATEVNDVTFTLSTERRRELEQRARSAAMADAQSKARALAASANLTVTGVTVIRTTSGDTPRPVSEGAAATETAVPTPGAPSELESGPVTVRTTVRVVYEADESGTESE